MTEHDDLAALRETLRPYLVRGASGNLAFVKGTPFQAVIDAVAALAPHVTAQVEQDPISKAIIGQASRELDEARAEIERLRGLVLLEQDTLNRVEDERDNLRDRLDAALARVERAEARVADLEGRLDTARRDALTEAADAFPYRRGLWLGEGVAEWLRTRARISPSTPEEHT